MAIRRIIDDKEPLLRKKSRVVEKFDDRLFTLLDDMKATLDKADGAGLAAVQVGVLKRVVIVDCDEKYGLLELINPEITETRGTQKEIEGCLSLPGRQGVTLRPEYVKVRAQDRNGEWREYEGSGLLARCFCHEIDHLDGVIYTDKLAPGEKVEYSD